MAPAPPSHVQLAPLMDKRVEIHGTSRVDMNGKCGIAIDFHIDTEDRTKGRYTVQLDSGEAFKLKSASVCVVGVGLEELYERGEHMRSAIGRVVDPNNAGMWAPLSASQQKEMDSAIVMLQEAMDQVTSHKLRFRFNVQTSHSLTMHRVAGPHRSSCEHRRHLQ